MQQKPETVRRRRVLLASSAALVVAGTLAFTAGAARAETRDPCADLAHKARVHLDMARGWNALGNTLIDIGFYSNASDAFAAGDYFSTAAEVYLSDARALDC